MWIPFETSLAGPPKAPAAYTFRRDPQEWTLAFKAEVDPYLHPTAGRGQFVEGLWAYDCAELFVASATNGRYVEINLAPNGAYWTCAFSAVRVRDHTCHPPSARSWGKLSAHSWEAGFTIPVCELERALESELATWRTNITLILGGCPDSDCPLENLHSVAKLGEPQPDFHRPQDWHPVR